MAITVVVFAAEIVLHLQGLDLLVFSHTPRLAAGVVLCVSHMPAVIACKAQFIISKLILLASNHDVQPQLVRPAAGSVSPCSYTFGWLGWRMREHSDGLLSLELV